MPDFHAPLSALPGAFISLTTLVVLISFFRLHKPDFASWRFSTSILLTAASIGVIAAFLSGIEAAEEANKMFQVPESAISRHYEFGRWLLICILPCTLLHFLSYIAKPAAKPVILAIFVVLLLASQILAICSNHHGGKLVFEHGAKVNVQAAQAY